MVQIDIGSIDYWMVDQCMMSNILVVNESSEVGFIVVGVFNQLLIDFWSVQVEFIFVVEYVIFVDFVSCIYVF